MERFFPQRANAEESKTDIAQLHFTAQGGGSSFFQWWGELVDRDQKTGAEKPQISTPQPQGYL